jgi:hydrogenase/urease accessory protein HupE
MRCWRFLLLLAGLIVLAPAFAHEIRPAYLELTQTAPSEFEVLWKVPTLSDGEMPSAAVADPVDRSISLPAGCLAMPLTSPGVLRIHPCFPARLKASAPPQVEAFRGMQVTRWILHGEGGMDDAVLAVHGLQATMIDALVRVKLLDGRSFIRVLRPEATTFKLDAAAAGAQVGDYFQLGVEHILLGVDHLLFVLGLLLLVRRVGRLVKTITAFTLAHTLTLGLATLGIVHVPQAPVEAMIALSILLVAVEIARYGADEPAAGVSPWLMAFVFGLLHGFGFAGALSEVGLPAGDIPLALLLFNLGVEAGQLCFVGAVLLIFAAVQRWAPSVLRTLRTLLTYRSAQQQRSGCTRAWPVSDSLHPISK